MDMSSLFRKLFVTGEFFTIGIRKKRIPGILNDLRFVPEYILPATGQKWAADPMLVDFEGKTFLFYEAVVGDKGHIEVAKVRDDCTLEEPVTILKDECHYSYPFVFRHDAQWYMIPESSAASEVRLYRAVSFPDKWELQDVLLREKTVDTTVFVEKGQMYLLTFFLVPGCERVIPHAYKMELEKGKARLEEIPWEAYDTLQVRGAGPVFRWEEGVYRPAQISQEQRYGDGIAFCRVNAGDTYKEKQIVRMTAKELKISGYYADGLHTYCASESFEAIDIRCGTVELNKSIKRLGRLLRK